MEVNYKYLGASNGIVEAANDGEESTVRCTSCSYALMSSFVRQHLEALIYANQCMPAYADLSCYASWRVELFRTDGLRKRNKNSHNDIVIVDRDDPKGTNL